jgi:hypothetical protein
MTEQTHPKQPPLTIAETAAKLREKPHTLICCEEDVLAMLKGLIQEGFYTVPVSAGHWELVDVQNPFVKTELRTDRLLKAGQNYVIEHTVLEWSKPSLELNFPPQTESMVWSRLMYGSFWPKGEIW